MSFTLQPLLDRSLALSLFLFLCGTLAHAQGNVVLVQHASKDAGTTTSSSLAFNANNTAGNWIGVCIRAGKSGQVFTVTDSNGNTYHKAVQFNVTIDPPNGDTLGIFYAENVAGGANTIAVSDTISDTMRFAILEYSGVATANSLDTTTTMQGTSASPNSGNATTTADGDLLLGAILTGNPSIFRAGSGYTIEETVPAVPDTKLVAEDQVQAVAGSISATASLAASDNWGAGLAAFKAAAGGVIGPSITATGGTPQSATINTAFATPLQATVKDSLNNPVSGVVVTFTAPGSGASGTFANGTATTTATTNGSGVATSTTFTANATAGGPYNVVASATGATSANFALTNTASAPASIALVQHTSKDAGSAASSSLAFNAINTAGNWIGVVIRAGGSSSQLFTVKDSNGNAYSKAVQLNVTVDAPNGDTLGIFYAENIKGGANTITVSDTISGTLRFAILEYSGVAMANSLDTTAAVQGTSATPNSGNATTTANGDLLLGAILTGNPASFTAGNGYRIEETVPAEPNTKLVAEDQIQATAGSVSAGALLGGPDNWGAGLAAFKAVAGGGAPPPSITNVNPTSGLVGTSVTITGANFGATRGTSTVAFNGIATTPTSWSATSIVAPVPNGATTGNIVVTVGGVASNGVSFTVQSDTTPPVVTITAPTNNSTVSATITLTATTTDPDSAVSFVQFLVDGTNTGAQLTAAPYSLSLDTTTLSNATHSLTAVAQDPSGNVGTSAAVTIAVSNTTNTAMGPLKQSTANPHYFVNPSGKAVLLSGSHTWDDFQDTDTSASPAAFDFNDYVNFLKSRGHNVTILWRKDLPTYCGWGAGGTWHMAPFPWKRTGGSSGTQVASDGLPSFDLTQLDQTYFDRLRARAIQLQQNGIYAIVELFDGLGLTVNRCSSDGYPFTGGNNVNGVDDGGGMNSMTMSAPNAITNYQDAYVQKVIDSVNDLPNVLWEISEESPGSSWWNAHMVSLIHTYEAGKPYQHPVGLAAAASDAAMYDSNADWVAPVARISPTSSCGSGTPACKVNINDSDHSYFEMWNDSAQVNRNYVWENFTSGDSVMFMDPYLIYWTSGNRNLCQSPSNGVCSGPDSRWDSMRNNLGYTISYANKMDLLKMTPQGGLSSTGYCLAQTPSVGAEYLVYAPNGGSFTVDLSATNRILNVEWFDPSSGTTTSSGNVSGGSTPTFTPPFGGDAVLYLVDAAGHN